jgi:hypothetical protein
MKPEVISIGTPVRVRKRHRTAERRGMVGRVVDQYGGEGFIAVDVRFPDGQQRLFWPEDLEEVSSPKLWWRSLLSRGR